MKFTPEDFAEAITHRLFKNNTTDEIALARIQYGLSIIIGITLELFAAILISLPLGITIYTLIIMMAALSFRLFSGGAHLTSYMRCLIFTLIYFLPFSALIKFLYHNYPSVFMLKASIALMALLFLLMFKKRIYLNIAFLLNLIILSALILYPHAFTASISLAMSTGLFLQTITTSKFGDKAINFVDLRMKNIGL